MQRAEELYVLLLSPNKSSSYITFAEKKAASVLQKTTSKTWRRCPSSENSDTSKMANSATQFKAGNELVPAELCQRTGRSLKTSKEMRSIQVPPSPPPSARMQQKQDPSPHPATTQLWFKREQNIWNTASNERHSGSTIKWRSRFYSTENRNSSQQTVTEKPPLWRGFLGFLCSACLGVAAGAMSGNSWIHQTNQREPSSGATLWDFSLC